MSPSQLNKDCLVSALIEVATSFVAAIVRDGVGGVESLHERTEVCLRGHENKVKMLCEAQDYVKLSLVIPLLPFIFCTYSIIF